MDIGAICNFRCLFCYHLKHLNNYDVPPLETLRRRLTIFKKCNIETVDITGGEPTVRPDLPEIVHLIRRDFNIEHVCIITNGFRMADLSYIRSLQEAGVDECLFSLHGSSAEVHDSLVGVEGSFHRLMKAIENAEKLNLRIRVNTTVTKKNYEDIVAIARLLSGHKIENLNYIMLNPILDASILDKSVIGRYSDAAPHLKEVADKYGTRFEFLHFKYLPFCIIPGYEKFIVNLLQTSYVPFEWDFFLRAQLRRGWMMSSAGVAAGLFGQLDVRNVQGRDWAEVKRDAFLHFQEKMDKVKPLSCRRCRHRLICSGIWRRYCRLYGTREFQPVQGEVVLRPYHFL